MRPAAREAGIPESSLRRWREHPELAQLRAEKKDDVRLDVWAGFQKGVARMVVLLEDEKDLSKAATATGVLYDKYALMSGEATGRTEHRDLTDDITDDERARLRDWINALPATSPREAPAG